jgi:8-amino-7-oxononanoate synthase
MRLWQSRRPSPPTHDHHQQQQRQAIPFAHNSVSDLEHKLLQIVNHQATSSGETRRVVIIVESVYSMDGDCGPLPEILALAKSFHARVVVDEAHGLGAVGPTGLLASLGLQQHPSLLATIYTFGKGAGCHGAVITGSHTLKSYLINFGFPFIYSTALPLHSLCTIQAAYETMTSAKGDTLRFQLKQLIEMFQSQVQSKLARIHTDISLIPSTTAIQALVVPGNKRCSDFCYSIWQRSTHRIRLFPIKSPTVPSGKERVRIVLHAHNTMEQVQELLDLLLETIQGHHLQAKL